MRHPELIQIASELLAETAANQSAFDLSKLAGTLPEDFYQDLRRILEGDDRPYRGDREPGTGTGCSPPVDDQMTGAIVPDVH